MKHKNTNHTQCLSTYSSRSTYLPLVLQDTIPLSYHSCQYSNEASPLTQKEVFSNRNRKVSVLYNRQIMTYYYNRALVQVVCFCSSMGNIADRKISDNYIILEVQYRWSSSATQWAISLTVKEMTRNIGKYATNGGQLLPSRTLPLSAETEKVWFNQQVLPPPEVGAAPTG